MLHPYLAYFTWSCETLYYRNTARRYNPEDLELSIHRRESLKSRIFILTFQRLISVLCL